MIVRERWTPAKGLTTFSKKGSVKNGAKLGLRIFAVFGAVTEFLKDMAVSGEELKGFGTTLDRAGFSPAGAEGNQVPANEPEQRQKGVASDATAAFAAERGD